MKRLALLVLLSAIASAQEQAPPPAPVATNLPERVAAPAYSDLYCSGFITKQQYPKSNFIAAGRDTPDTSLFSQGDIVFLMGSGYQPNQLLSVVRELKDPNQYEPFPGARKAVSEAGQPYADLGRIRVLRVETGSAIGRLEFSCESVSAGDLLIPFEERQPVAFRPGKPSHDQFPEGDASNLTARIIMSKDFDMFFGSNKIVYINAGGEKGVKPGQYFRAMRGLSPKDMDPAQALSYAAPRGVETQKNAPNVTTSDLEKLPQRVLGEMIVLNVTPTASTAMVTYAFEDMKVGDKVELEAPQQ